MGPEITWHKNEDELKPIIVKHLLPSPFGSVSVATALSFRSGVFNYFQLLIRKTWSIFLSSFASPMLEFKSQLKQNLGAKKLTSTFLHFAFDLEMKWNCNLKISCPIICCTHFIIIKLFPNANVRYENWNVKL